MNQALLRIQSVFNTFCHFKVVCFCRTRFCVCFANDDIYDSNCICYFSNFYIIIRCSIAIHIGCFPHKHFIFLTRYIVNNSNSISDINNIVSIHITKENPLNIEIARFNRNIVTIVIRSFNIFKRGLCSFCKAIICIYRNLNENTRTKLFTIVTSNRCCILIFIIHNGINYHKTNSIFTINRNGFISDHMASGSILYNTTLRGSNATRETEIKLQVSIGVSSTQLNLQHALSCSCNFSIRC